jgi:Tfp pilus assembly protein PilO
MRSRLAVERVSRVGGKRAPIYAGIAVVAVVLIMTFFLVLPKMGQVKDANATLTEAQAEQATLGAQLAALQQAQAEAPVNRETIRKVQQAIPPTVDQQGFMLLVQNAALESSVDVVTVSPSNPVFDPATGLSTVTNSLSVAGSYFAITEFLFKIETLPRAAKTTSVSIVPSPSETNASLLTVTMSVDMYTSDQSAGPGSTPGPTSSAGATTPAASSPPAGASPAAETSQGA